MTKPLISIAQMIAAAPDLFCASTLFSCVEAGLPVLVAA